MDEPKPTPDEALWRRRFLITTLVKLAALAIFFLGIAIAYTDLIRPGGWPQVGAVLVILGAIDMLLAPRMLRKLWRREDGEI